MACFLVPGAEAVVTTVVQKLVEKREKDAVGRGRPAATRRYSWSRRLRWLNTMLWGGTLLLALEHAWHGEIAPWSPFLTAMSSTAEMGAMLRELATYGVAMAAAVTAVWGVMVLVAEARARGESLPGAEPTSPGEGA